MPPTQKVMSFPEERVPIPTENQQEGKLMWSNRPQAKFCLQSDSNSLLIDFFDPISAVRFTRRDDSIWIRTRIRSKKLIYIKNQLKFIEIYQI